MLHSHFAGERHSEDLLVGRERGIPPAFATCGHMNGWWKPCSNKYWKNICYKTHWKMNLNDGHWLFWLSGKLGGTFDKTKWRLLDRANMNHCNINVVLEFCLHFVHHNKNENGGKHKLGLMISTKHFRPGCVLRNHHIAHCTENSHYSMVLDYVHRMLCYLVDLCKMM